MQSVMPKSFSLPVIDLSGQKERHVVIAQGSPEVYHGHPTTLLLPDGKTMFVVWTYGHGGACGPMKKSLDGGLSWSDLLPVPDNWATVYNCPALYRLVDPQGRARLFVFAGHTKTGTIMHQAYSEDEGATWTPMEANGIENAMPWCTIAAIGPGAYIAQTNARRKGDPDPRSNIIVQSSTFDGGLTWQPAKIVLDMPGFKPCEPAIVRSPDGGQLACLLRENTRKLNSLLITSDDNGATWSPPVELPASLIGDRHMARYSHDGRLVVAFRDKAQESPTKDHFVAWVGTYDDIASGREGQYRIKLLHSYAGWDCGYSGLELLPDGTFVATTYIKYRPGPEKNSIVSTRFKLEEIDAYARGCSGADQPSRD